MAVIELFVDQFLAIDQGTPVSNPQGQQVFQIITFTDLAKNYRSYHPASQLLIFGQEVSLRRSIYNISVSHYLPFYDSGSSGPSLQGITQFFWIGQEAKVVEFEQLSDTITFTQTVTVDFVKNATNTLVMTDAAICNVVKSIEVQHTLIVGSSGTGYILKQESYSIALPTLSGPNAPEC